MKTFQPYVYEIEHKPTCLKYIGSKSAQNCNPEELLKADGYLTSSRIIKEFIKKDGLGSFKINWIVTCKTRKDALELEADHLIKVDARNNRNYINLHNNDMEINKQKLCEFYHVIHMSQLPEVKEKISKSRAGQLASEETKEKMKKSHKELWENQDRRLNQSKNVSGENNPMFGKTHTFEAKKKISDSRKIQSHSDERKEKQSQFMLENNPMSGKHHSAETREKIRLSQTGKTLSTETREKLRRRTICPHCGKESNVSNMTRYHFDNCKAKEELKCA